MSYKAWRMGSSDGQGGTKGRDGLEGTWWELGGVGEDLQGGLFSEDSREAKDARVEGDG
jgi:hypothetical protein